MEFPRLEFTRQDAEIEIKTHNARVEISTRRLRFRLRRSLARFQMDSRMPTMRVNRTAMFSALGVGPVLQTARQYFNESIQHAIEYIGSVSADGDALMRIENGGNAIADLGVQASDTPGHDLNISALPPPEINWEPGYINVNWTPASLETEWDMSGCVDIRVEPHYVEIKMKKYPGVRIRVIYDTKRAKAGGKHVDKYL